MEYEPINFVFHAIFGVPSLNDHKAERSYSEIKMRTENQRKQLCNMSYIYAINMKCVFFSR